MAIWAHPTAPDFCPLATVAGDAGADLAALMRQTRHQSTAVALGYLRPAELWRNNVTARVFGRLDTAGDD